MGGLKELEKEHALRGKAIKKRLKEFREKWKESDGKIFEELTFCLLTPQSKAKACDASVKKMAEKGCLLKGNEHEIRSCLHNVRFPIKKPKFIVEAREKFSENGKIAIKKKLREAGIERDPVKTRHWLLKNVKGLGLKECGHFLRNIGFGKDVAILDRHILRNLVRFGALKELPKTLTEKKYYEIENKMKKFAQRAKIPFDELDLLFWSKETGEIFK